MVASAFISSDLSYLLRFVCSLTYFISSFFPLLIVKLSIFLVDFHYLLTIAILYVCTASISKRNIIK